MAGLSGARRALEAVVAVGGGLAPRPRSGGMGRLDGARRRERPGGNRDDQTTRADASGKRKRTGPEEWLVVTRCPLADEGTLKGQASPDACDQDARYGYRYYLTPTCVAMGTGGTVPGRTGARDQSGPVH